jgi:hypothetical protein
MAPDNGVPTRAGPSDAVRAALITAVATVVITLGGIAINSCATNDAQESAQRAALKQQALAFRNQRAVANRRDLRRVLDEAGVAQEDAIAQLDRFHQRWKTTKAAIPRRSLRRLAKVSKYSVRLGLRIGRHSPIWKIYRRALEQMIFAKEMMFQFPPNAAPRVVTTIGTVRVPFAVRKARRQIRKKQDTFAMLARQHVRPP